MVPGEITLSVLEKAIVKQNLINLHKSICLIYMNVCVDLASVLSISHKIELLGTLTSVEKLSSYSERYQKKNVNPAINL